MNKRKTTVVSLALLSLVTSLAVANDSDYYNYDNQEQLANR